VNAVEFSPDSKTLALVTSSNTVKLVEIDNGKTRHSLQGHAGPVMSVQFNKDGSQLLTNSMDTTARLWNPATGKLLRQIDSSHWEYNPSYFEKDGEVIHPALQTEMVEVYGGDGFEVTDTTYLSRPVNPYTLVGSRSRTGKYQYRELLFQTSILTGFKDAIPGEASFIRFSSSERYFAWVNNFDDTLLIADLETGRWIHSGRMGIGVDSRYGAPVVKDLEFTPDDKFLVIVDANHVAHFIDLQSFRITKTRNAESISFSEDGRYAALVNEGRTVLYDYPSWKPLYSFVSVNDEDHLVIDEAKRFDGTSAARNTIYFSCGDEIIELAQFKDKLWVPDLTERIMAGDSIYAAGIESLQVCGIAPKVRQDRAHQYIITPGSGGLGETVVYVNGIEAQRLQPGQLKKEGNEFRLVTDPVSLEQYYIAQTENTVTVRAYTKDNSISSRGFEVKDSSRVKSAAAPNLYAVMIGVSNYKGETLDLKFAAKDANDLSAALAAAAKKLLNTDGKEHVFTYRLTTDNDRDRMPEKEAIRKTLEEIGRKATPNDILLIFFAGHGVMSGADKKFYFLSADAASADDSSTVAETGISTAELTEWIQPSSLKAQKRILIFDACNSGQAIRDMIRIGHEDQGYVAARNEDRGRQAKLIEKLNERSGFTILSAAASNQSAYEMGRYAQGLLTYSLLKTIRDEPGILVNGKFLDILRWFQATQNTVENILDNTSTRQQPELISNTSFVIGLVDEQVLNSIQLPNEKAMFGSSIIVNAEGYSDDLRLSRQVNRMLSEMSGGSDAKLVFAPDSDLDSYHFLNGKYTVTGNLLRLDIDLLKGTEKLTTFRVSGAKEDPTELISMLRGYIENYLK
jgi:uncharacterized caspase-like protein